MLRNFKMIQIQLQMKLQMKCFSSGNRFFRRLNTKTGCSCINYSKTSETQFTEKIKNQFGFESVNSKIKQAKGNSS